MHATLALPPPLVPDLLLTRRSEQAEVMDEPAVPPADYAQCLADLAEVNRVTRTHAPIVSWVARQVRSRPEQKRWVVLDVAFGQGDLLRALARWGRRQGVELELHGLDLNPRSAVQARAATPAELNVTFHTGDVFTHDCGAQPDLIVSSQFTHHLATPDIARFVRWCERTAARGWFIADLERSALAFRGFPLLCALAGWHDLVRRDGQVSIARSLKRDEWRTLVAEAGVPAEVSRCFPFRLSITSAQ